jgi:hypothetical protein
MSPTLATYCRSRVDPDGVAFIDERGHGDDHARLAFLAASPAPPLPLMLGTVSVT